jgi:hypothetical protein
LSNDGYAHVPPDTPPWRRGGAHRASNTVGVCDPEAAVVLVVRDIETATRWYRYVFKLQVESERPGNNGLPIEAALRRRGGPNLVLLLARATCL